MEISTIRHHQTLVNYTFVEKLADVVFNWLNPYLWRCEKKKLKNEREKVDKFGEGFGWISKVKEVNVMLM